MFRNCLKAVRLGTPLSLLSTKQWNTNRIIVNILQKNRNNNHIVNCSSIQSLHTNIKLHSEENKPQNDCLIVNEHAEKRLRKVLENKEALRIGVKGGGCSGFEYQFEIVARDSVVPDNDILLCDGMVVVDKESLEYMNGATLDYEEELIRSGFKVSNNPLAEKGCSCGASFSLKF